MYVRPVSAASIKSVAKNNKNKKTFSTQGADRAAPILRPHDPAPLVDHLLSIQFQAPLESLDYGDKILDILERLRHDVLEDRSSTSALTDLLYLLQTQKIASADPLLAQVIEEIEVRAAVELAKREKGDSK